MNQAKKRQKRKTGYIASSLRSSGTISLMKWTDEQVDQKKATATQINLMRMCTTDPISKLTIAAIFNGKRQQPNRQMLQKKEMLPPRSCPLMAITAPPIHTIQNTISNRSVLSSALVAMLNTAASIRQKKKGPQRSQLRISFRFASVSTLANGLITIRSFCQMRCKSRFYDNTVNMSRL